ncbi:MAG TPA: HAMP domain-containing protein [Candidatus Avacidaminococcus intestinavium]|uniref:histidine kinase n=1 Tax=Candidatus Avacidaminococcus intestinavium TaxID=2840684 RepID=A0A9D1MR70_9FIRM|nr:HAMP domain-containing protein [Candidatus Avacidaminococcus intestinavium]
MRNKIALKLTIYFAAALLIFSLVVGSSFRILFRQHAEDLKRMELEQRATKIAQIMSETREQLANWQERRANLRHDTSPLTPEQQHPGPFATYGSLLYFLSTSAADDVWVINSDKTLERRDLPAGTPIRREITYKDLPEDANSVVAEAFDGKTVFSQGFSPLLEMPTLSVGVPIKSKNGTITGVVLVHSPLSGLDEATSQGMKILLVSGSIALLLGFFFSLFFSWKFTKPLNLMKKTAEKMAEGDYSVRSGVKQDDEIGDLGNALDILGERLELASQESAKLDQLRKDFIANISHELRTPVTVIRGSLDAICDRVVTSKTDIAEYHRQMLAESIFLQRLINDLLDLSRLQNNNFQIEKSPLNFYEVVKDVVRSSYHIGQKKNVDIHFESDQELYPMDGDYGRLRQMLMIFMDNAIKFSPAEKAIQVHLNEGRLTITDYGCGIKPKDLPHIFERFYKARTETNKSGTGLGLSIAKEIAERHGIDLKMESEEKAFTKVILLLSSMLKNR